MVLGFNIVLTIALAAFGVYLAPDKASFVMGIAASGGILAIWSLTSVLEARWARKWRGFGA